MWVLVCCLWFSVGGWFVLVGVDLCVWSFIHSASVDWLGGWWCSRCLDLLIVVGLVVVGLLVCTFGIVWRVAFGVCC